MAMNVNIVSIGTSKGIRIPKALLKQFNFKNSVDLKILPEGLLLQANTEPRSGWAELFANSAEENVEFADWVDQSFTTFDEVEW
jgi:antitoxin MazE